MLSRSVPAGTVQLLRNKGENEDDDSIKPNHALKDDDIVRLLTQIFNSDMGSRVFKRMEKALKEMIKKGAGRNHPYSKEKALNF